MNKRLLVADDHREVADTLAMLLRHNGFEVEVAYDGEQTIQIALAFNPDVFILDLGMPNTDGFQTAQRLRAMPQFGSKLFVALTGYTDQQHLDEATKSHFDEYLFKPCNVDLLKTILSESTNS